jgi:hypothetical protein
MDKVTLRQSTSARRLFLKPLSGILATMACLPSIRWSCRRSDEANQKSEVVLISCYLLLELTDQRTIISKPPAIKKIIDPLH